MSSTPVIRSPSIDPFSTPAQLSRYILSGIAGAFLWDILNNIKDDYILVTKYRIRLPTIVYFISKLTSFAYAIICLIFETVSGLNCMGIVLGAQVLFIVSLASTSLLFFFRARAVFEKNPWADAFFGILWLAVLGGCLDTLAPGAIVAKNIGSTGYCVDGIGKRYTSTASFIPLFYDTIIFVAISWRLWRNSFATGTVRDSARVLFFGQYLPAFSRSILKDGQAYYLATVAVNVITQIILSTHPIPALFRSVFTVPNTSLTSIMACRVYRKTMFGLIKEPQISAVVARDLNAARSVVIPLSLQEGSGSSGAAASTSQDKPDDITTGTTGIVQLRTIDDSSPMSDIDTRREMGNSSIV